MPRPAEEVVEQMLDAVKRSRERRVSSADHVQVEVELGRECWLSRHCGARMWQVKVSYIITFAHTDDGREITRRERMADENICPVCLYHYDTAPLPQKW